MPFAVSLEAAELLDSLQGGDGNDIAVPSVYPGAGAFTDHAMAFFSNAAALCRDPHAHDFAIFGVLYSIRHGLELWLKNISQHDLLDNVLDSLYRGDNLEQLVSVAQARCSTNGERKARREQLVLALCVLRNTARGLTHPECWQDEVSEGFASNYLEQRTTPKRYQLALAWPVPVYGHELRALWASAKQSVVDGYRDARVTADESADGVVVEPDTIGALCDLLGALDPDGDAFRYPCSLGGKWYAELPHFNLKKLGALAEQLESTVLAYESRSSE